MKREMTDFTRAKSMDDKPERLFIGLPVPEEIVSNLKKLFENIPQIKFPANLHLTLRFIGETLKTEAIKERLKTVQTPPFTLKLARTGFFNKRIFWLGLTPNPALSFFKQSIDKALFNEGFAPENRPFKPHITLRRFKIAPDPDTLQAIGNLAPEGEWQAEVFYLFQSQLTPAGAIHKILTSYPLWV